MTRRPKVMSLDDLTASVAAEPPAPAPVEQPPEPVPTDARAAHARVDDDPSILHHTPRKRTLRKPQEPAEETVRTTHYFRRSVHDVLREIAFKERKKVSSLMNEGLDRMLRARGYPPLAEIWQEDAKS